MNLVVTKISLFRLFGIFFAVILGLSGVLSSAAAQGRNPEVVFLLDASNSMNTTDPDYLAPDCLAQMLYGLPSNYDAGFIAYGSQLQTVLPISADDEAIGSALRQIRYAGYTNAGEGLEKALELFSTSPLSPKAVVLISDGEILLDSEQKTRDSLEKFNRAKREAAARGVRVITIAIGGRQNAPNVNVYDAGGASDSLYEPASAGQLAEIANKVLFEELKTPKLSVGAGNMHSGNLTFKLPTQNAASVDRARVLVASDAPIGNVAASYGAADGQVRAGKRYALVELEQPQSGEIQLQLSAADNAQIRSDLMIEMKASVKAEIVGTAARAEGGKNVQVRLTPLHAKDGTVHLLKDPYFEGRSVRVIAGGREIAASVSDGAISFDMPDAGDSSVDIAVRYEDLGINVFTDEKTVVAAPRREINPLYITLAVCAIALIGALIWRKRKKTYLPKAPLSPSTSCYAFAGKLKIYVTKLPDDSDVAPMVYNLYRHYSRDAVSLGSILEKCGVKHSFAGAYKIWFSPGANKALIVENRSDCTILKNRDLLIKNHSCLAYFNERIHITFEDEYSELVLEYKNVKPSEKQ